MQESRDEVASSEWGGRDVEVARGLDGGEGWTGWTEQAAGAERVEWTAWTERTSMSVEAGLGRFKVEKRRGPSRRLVSVASAPT